MVSEKMTEALDVDRSEYSTWTEVEVAQAVVNAAWTVFDKDDESTWPDRHYYLVMTERGISGGVWIESGKEGCYWAKDMLGTVTHYADPQDLMFKDI